MKNTQLAIAGFEDGKRKRNSDNLQKLEREGNGFSTRTSRGMRFCQYLGFRPNTHFRFLNYKIIKLCYFKLTNFLAIFYSSNRKLIHLIAEPETFYCPEVFIYRNSISDKKAVSFIGVYSKLSQTYTVEPSEMFFSLTCSELIRCQLNFHKY